jgi:hypothetical protein
MGKATAVAAKFTSKQASSISKKEGALPRSSSTARRSFGRKFDLLSSVVDTIADATSDL